MNWNKIFSVMKTDTIRAFADGRMSMNDFYSYSVKYGVGPEVRSLKRGGASRGRKITKDALRRRLGTK